MASGAAVFQFVRLGMKRGGLGGHIYILSCGGCQANLNIKVDVIGSWGTSVRCGKG